MVKRCVEDTFSIWCGRLISERNIYLFIVTDWILITDGQSFICLPENRRRAINVSISEYMFYWDPIFDCERSNRNCKQKSRGSSIKKCQLCSNIHFGLVQAIRLLSFYSASLVVFTKSIYSNIVASNRTQSFTSNRIVCVREWDRDSERVAALRDSSIQTNEFSPIVFRHDAKMYDHIDIDRVWETIWATTATTDDEK